jgi:hypothetical protein
MKTVTLGLLAALLGMALSSKAGSDTPVFEHSGRDGLTNQWFISEQQIDRSPRWDPLKGDVPPLSVPGAVKIASAWLERQRSTNQVLVIWGPPKQVEAIKIKFLPSTDPRWHGVSWYIIMFETGQFDHRACVVLMDGSVLEPRVEGIPARRGQGARK